MDYYEVEDLIEKRIAIAMSKLTIQAWDCGSKKIEVTLLYDGKVISQDSMFVG